MALPFNILTFNNLRGLNTKASKTQKQPNEAEFCENGFFDRTGAFVKRKGGEKYNATSLANRITGLYDFTYAAGASQKILITAGTDIYNGNSGSPSSIKSWMTSNVIYDFTQFYVTDDLFTNNKDFCFITNGSDTPLKYDGTTVTNWGIAIPNYGTMAGAGAAGGGLTASSTYKFHVTFESADGVESNPAATGVTATTGVGQGTINLTNIPVSSDAQVTKRNIYMTSAGGNTYLYNQSINDNVTTSLSVTIESTGALLEYDHDVPGNFYYIETIKDRVVAARTTSYPNRFFFSKQYAPFYFPETFYFDVGDGKPITGIKAFYDYTLIFKENEMYLFSGDNEYNYRLDRIRADELIGCVSNRSIVVYENWCYFLGSNSFYRTNGNIVQDCGYPIQDYFNLYPDDDEFQIVKTDIGEAVTCVDKENSIIILFVPTGGATENNTGFCMGLDDIIEVNGRLMPNWGPWTGLITTTAGAIIRVAGRDRWFRGDDTGYVWQMNTLNGDGAEDTSTVTSATNNTLSDSTQAWTVNLYTGLRVKIVSGLGVGQERLIASNTGTQITVTANWDTNPDTTSVYSIGWFDYSYQHSWNDYGQPSLSKRWRYVRPRFDTTGDYTVTYSFGFDFTGADVDETETDFLTNADTWDSSASTWDSATWDGQEVSDRKYPVIGSHVHRWSNFKVASNRAGQPIIYNGCDKIFMTKGTR